MEEGGQVVLAAVVTALEEEVHGTGCAIGATRRAAFTGVVLTVIVAATGEVMAVVVDVAL